MTESKGSCGRDLDEDGPKGEVATLAGNLQGANYMHPGHEGGGENRGGTLSPNNHAFFSLSEI